ncbi:MAG TPA: hypothetical protein VGD27_00605 [Longimicrobiales bacterium]
MNTPMFPYDAVVGVLPDENAVRETVTALNASGFDDQEITVLAGPEGIDMVDIQGKHHGLRGRIFRALDTIGDEHDESVTHLEALRAGRLVLGVHVDNEEEKTRALEAFKKHNGEHVSYYSRWTSERLIR